MKTKLIH